MSRAVATDARLGAWQVAGLALCLAVSVLAGRQLYMDGASYVVHALIDPGWYPHPTPRRFFAILWSTLPVRLVGIVATDQIVLGSLLFGIVSYALILVPVVVLLRANLPEPVRAVLLIGFLAATIILANFIVGELVFSLALTVLFVVFTLDPSWDRRGRWRLLLGVLLVASYETALIVGPLLALGSVLQAGGEPDRSRSNRIAVPLVLCLAVPFQIGFYMMNPWPGPDGVRDPFVWVIAAVFTASVLGLLALLRVMQALGVPAAPVIALCLLLPVAMLLVPEALGLRSRSYRYAYPSRYFSCGAQVVIALLPVLLHPRLGWPARLMGWIGTPTLRNLSFAMLAGFCGISLMASADAHAFRTRFERSLAGLEDIVPLAECRFCMAPEAKGKADLGYRWIWPVYSMAYTMRRPDRPPVIVLGRDGISGDLKQETVTAFLARQHERRARPQ